MSGSEGLLVEFQMERNRKFVRFELIDLRKEAAKLEVKPFRGNRLSPCHWWVSKGEVGWMP